MALIFIVAAAIAATQTTGPKLPAIAEFFPVTAGSSWVYEDNTNNQALRCEDSALPVVEQDGKYYYPITSFINERHSEVTYYSFEGTSVLLSAFDLKKPLDKPYPILKLVENGLVKWEHSGTTMIFDEQGPLTLKGSSRFIKEYKFQNKNYPAIEVTLEAKIEIHAGTFATSSQKAVYCKGIGLVLMRETGGYGKQRFARVRKLISYKIGEPPK